MAIRIEDRRDFLKITGLGGLAWVLKEEPLGEGSPSPAGVPRPNILWITAEDISPDLCCYGEDYAVTPHLDRLAGEGTRFLRAFSHAGVCAPARSGIITGMYPTTIGTHHMRCKGVPPPEVRCFTEYLRAGGYYCSNQVKTDYQFDAPLTAWDDCSGKAHWRGRDPGQPFFSVINITTTHESRIRSRDRKLLERIAALGPKERHDPARAKLPPYYPDTPLTRRDWARYADLVTLMDLEAAGILQQLEEDGLAEDTIVWFYGDHGRGLPRAKRWIYDSGIHVPLIIRVPEKFRSLADPANPGALAPGSVNDDLVSFIDFGATALSLAGAGVPRYMQGRPFLGPQKAAPRNRIFAARDRMDEAYDLIRALRDKRFKYIRNFMPHIPYGQDIEYMNEMPTMREMRRLHGEGKLAGPERQYFRESKPLEELYDTEADPHEVENLAGMPEYEDRLLTLREALRSWMRDTEDVGLIPESYLDELMRPGGAWEKTAEPALVLRKGKTGEEDRVEISCSTPGASLAYRIRSGKGEAAWKLYTGPVPLEHGQGISARACRLGFRDSDEVHFDGKSLASSARDVKHPPPWRERIVPDLLDRLLDIQTLDFDGAGAAARYLELLQDEEAPVRYWAVLGLSRLLEKEGPREDIEYALLERLADPSPSPSIAAAEALCRIGRGETALPVLTRSLQSPIESVGLFAISSLYRLGMLARPALPSIQRAAVGKTQYVSRVARHILRRLEGE